MAEMTDALFVVINVGRGGYKRKSIILLKVSQALPARTDREKPWVLLRKSYLTENTDKRCLHFTVLQ
jgi:hypothetical protein